MKRIAVLVVLGTLFGAVLSFLFLQIPWFPTEGSREAGPINDMFRGVTYVSFMIFGWVMVALVWCVWRFRRQGETDMRDGSHLHGNTQLELFWTAIPFLIVVALGLWGWTVLDDNEAAASRSEHPVKVTAKLYSFNFKYLYSIKDGYVPEDGVYVAKYPDSFASDALVVPVDRQLQLRVRTANESSPGIPEVLHGFWVYAWGIKRDATPGVKGDGVSTITVIPTRQGYFQVQCTELCGSGHSGMNVPKGVHVVTSAQYATWFAQQVAAAKAQAVKDASGGKGLAVFNSQGCSGCHAFTPAGSNAQTGPSLNDISSDASAAGKPLADFIRESIVNPGAYTAAGFAQGIMPKTYGTSIKPADLDDLVAYLAKGGKQ